MATAPTPHIERLPVSDIAIDNTAFMFRASLRLASLKRSIQAEGQQIPVIVRPLGCAEPVRYQLISGFRRATAIEQLGLDTISAVVRHDLDDDEAAFRVAIIENEQRKTYSDLDRALAILRYEQAGWSSVDVAELMGLGKSQKNNLKRLLTLPEPIQAAIDEPDDHVSATHGLVLGQLARRYPELDIEHWLAAVDDQQLSVAQLRRAVHRAHRPTGPEPLGSIFNAAATDRAQGIFRFDAVKVVIAELNEADRAQLRAELQELLGALG